jgi:hypothetical protein
LVWFDAIDEDMIFVMEMHERFFSINRLEESKQRILRYIGTLEFPWTFHLLHLFQFEVERLVDWG